MCRECSGVLAFVRRTGRVFVYACLNCHTPHESRSTRKLDFVN